MAPASTTKAKAIDTYLHDASSSDKLKGAASDVVWPEGENSNVHQKEEDLYGYGVAAPTPRDIAPLTADQIKYNRTPRRSSLKNPGANIPRRASIGYSGEMTLILRTGETAKKRISISFDDTKNRTREVESVADMVDDPNRLWFQKGEYQHIQRKINKILAEAKNNKDDDDLDGDACTRGLEPIMDSSGYMERREAWESVLEEQRMQKSNGRYDDDFIRDIYQFHTIDSKVKATDRAERDEKDVESYLKFTRKMCRRMSC